MNISAKEKRWKKSRNKYIRKSERIKIKKQTQKPEMEKKMKVRQKTEERKEERKEDKNVA